MPLETIFSVCSLLAMLGWAALILLPRFPWVAATLARLVIPGLIGLVYVVLMVLNFGNAPADSGFGSLAEVKALFSVDAALLAGWVHYLAFDLFVGSWEAADAKQHGVPHLLLVPALLATLMVGPAGLLLYLGLRAAVGWWRSRGVSGPGPQSASA